MLYSNLIQDENLRRKYRIISLVRDYLHKRRATLTLIIY